jgi:hypothetical protein
MQSSALLQGKNALQTNVVVQREDDDSHTRRTMCPGADEVQPLIEAAWKDFMQNTCKVSWTDVPSQLRGNLEGSNGGQVEIFPRDDATCKAIIKLSSNFHAAAAGPGDLGAVLQKAVDAWEIEPGSLLVEQVVEHRACDALIPRGTPEVVSLSEDIVDSVFQSVQRDFQNECGGDRYALGKKSLVEAKMTTSDAEWEYVLKILVTPPSREDQNLEVVVREYHVDDQGDAAVKRQIRWERRHEERYRAEHEARDDNEERSRNDGRGSLLSISNSTSTWEPIGTLLVHDDRYQPRLCSICGKCPDAEDDVADSADAALAQNLVIGAGNRTVPAHGDPNSFRSPPRSVHPDADLSKERWTGARTRSGPRLGDNFHSTILNQRSAEDHARVWAQSRALVNEIKWSGISIADEYHFFDDDTRAKCYTQVYN